MIMAKSFFLMISIIVRVFFMKLLVSQLLNKMGLLRGSINIFSMCFVFQAKIPNIFWSYSIKLVVHLINRLPIPFLNNRSPYELVYSIKPDFSNLKVFCCLAYASSTITRRTKLDFRSLKMCFSWL